MTIDLTSSGSVTVRMDLVDSQSLSTPTYNLQNKSISPQGEFYFFKTFSEFSYFDISGINDNYIWFQFLKEEKNEFRYSENRMETVLVFQENKLIKARTDNFFENGIYIYDNYSQNKSSDFLSRITKVIECTF